MISFRLWRSLMTPFVAHPIYWRNAVWRAPLPQNNWIARLWRGINYLIDYRSNFVLTFLLGGAVLITVCFGPTPLMIILFGIPLVVMFVLIPLGMIGVGTLYGMACVMRVSDIIANERIQGRFTLLGLTSQGYIGAAWAMCSLELHTVTGLKQVRRTVNSIYVVLIALLIMPLIFAFIVIFTSPDAFADSDYASIVSFALLALIIFIDYVQSTITGCLVGMIAPTMTRSRADTRLMAVGMYMMLQSAVYLLIAFVCLILWPVMFDFRIALDAAYLLLCTATFYVIREVIIVLLWLGLASRLETDLGEMKAVTRVDILSLRVL